MHRPSPPLGRQDFESFVAQATPSLLKTAFLLTWHESDTQDLVQETLARISRRWTAISRMDHPQAYARRVLVNLVAGTARTRWRTSEELYPVDNEGLEALTDLDAPTDEFEARSDLLQVLGRLAKRQRAVLVLRYYEDMTDSEIAETLDWPLGTVKSTASRALERLQKIYKTSEALPKEQQT
jgi:RNA polymerase sigma-70 factor (sigma-E family)